MGYLMPAKKAAKKAAAKPAEAPVAAEKPKKASKYPYKKLVVPPALQGVENGKLSGKQLAAVKCGGQMWAGCADKFNAMYDLATQSGIKLRNIGDYRPHSAQLGLFMQRYSTDDLGRKPQVTRTYDGKTWYLKPGMSPSSTPGKSNHGLGLAIDLDVTTAKVLDWLCLNAPNFGFYLQSDDPSSPEFEAWHWQYAG
jgi:LAS superfamily LD-carboxypeptidase LdcB